VYRNTPQGECPSPPYPWAQDQNNNYSTQQDIGQVFVVVGFDQPNVYIDIVTAVSKLLLSNNYNLKYGLSNMGTVNIWENRAD